MKIIGTTNDGFMVTVDHEEMAILSGASSQYSSNYTKPKPGVTVDLKALNERITRVERLISSGYAEAKNQVEVAFKAMETGYKLFQGIIKKDKPEE